jgi:hypothetical protein
MSSQRRSVFADDAVLQKHNCVKVKPEDITHDNPDSLSVNGWKFTTFHSVIPNEAETHSLVRKLKSRLHSEFESVRQEYPTEESLQKWQQHDSIVFNGFKLKMVPMIFTNDIMRISHCSASDESGGCIEINSEDALYCWIAQHTAECEVSHPIEAVQVPYAKGWNERHMQNTSSGLVTTNTDEQNNSNNSSNSSGAVTVASVFTATSSMAMSLASQSDDTSYLHTNNCNNNSSNSIGNSIATPIRKSFRPCDWTLTSDYCCSLKGGEKKQEEILSARKISAAYNNRCSNVTKCDVSGIDFELLKDTKAPILFYDECILYQDDLDDSGEVLYEAKLRVMPACWFLVSKYFLRVDGVKTVCRECRLFHKFDSNSGSSNTSSGTNTTGRGVVHMELTWRELAHSTAVPTIGTTSNSNTSSSNKGKAASTGVVSTTNDQSRNNSHLLPVVNDSEHVHRFYSFTV